MLLYTVPFDDVATGAVADTYKTMATIIVPDTTAGHRVRLRKLWLGPADNAPADLNLAIEIARIADFSVGTAGTAGTTITSTNMPKIDPGSVDAIFSAKIDYTAEPTAYEANPVWQGAMNIRAAMSEAFGEDEAPVAIRDQVLGILAAPRTAQAIRISGHALVEVF